MKALELGQAQGWRYWDDQEAGVWHWIAYTEKGSMTGEGTSPENCLSQIDSALLQLRAL